MPLQKVNMINGFNADVHTLDTNSPMSKVAFDGTGEIVQPKV
jgi:hypothetical protein